MSFHNLSSSEKDTCRDIENYLYQELRLSAADSRHIALESVKQGKFTLAGKNVTFGGKFTYSAVSDHINGLL